jgi:hypothetical protein
VNTKRILPGPKSRKGAKRTKKAASVRRHAPKCALSPRKKKRRRALSFLKTENGRGLARTMWNLEITTSPDVAAVEYYPAPAVKKAVYFPAVKKVTYKTGAFVEYRPPAEYPTPKQQTKPAPAVRRPLPRTRSRARAPRRVVRTVAGPVQRATVDPPPEPPRSSAPPPHRGRS